MKKLSSLIALTLLLFTAVNAQVGINILNPDSSAVLQLESTSKGLGLPRLTSIQRDSITNPLKGLTIYNTVDSLIEYWNGECWLRAYQRNCSECDFVMSVDHASDTIDRTVNDSVIAVVSAHHLNGSQPISLIFLSSLPNGVSISYNGSPTIDSTGSISITVKADLCSPVGGNFPIIIEGFCGDQIHFQTFNVYIRPPISINIPTDVMDYNLQTINALPSTPAQFILLNIGNSVELRSSNSTNPAYTSGNIDANSLVCINNNGHILGRGGDGGGFTFSGTGTVVGGTPGVQGGDAMHLTCRHVLNNNGSIYGAGSGGGSVGFAFGFTIPLINLHTAIGFGFCGGGGSESGLGGTVNQGTGLNLGIFQAGGNATCCIGSVPGLGPTASYPINIPISIATLQITPSAYGGNGGGFAQSGTRGYLNVALGVCVSIPFIGNTCVNIPIPGGFLPFYGPYSAGPGEAIKRNGNSLVGLPDGNYNSTQVKGVVGP